MPLNIKQLGAISRFFMAFRGPQAPYGQLRDTFTCFVEADPTRCVAEMVHRWKGFTSHVLRTEFASWRSRRPTLWSRSSYAGTVGSVSQAVVRNYIEAQKRK